MAVNYRPMERTDVSGFRTLQAAYHQELLNFDGGPAEEVIIRDGFGERFRVILAEMVDIIGFAAWAKHYDLHHGLVVGEVLDMYVAPGYRGCGIAAQLIAETAAAIKTCGGTFVKGQVLTGEDHTARFYDRISHQFPGADCYVSGRAFRSLADLAGVDVRTLLKSLLHKDWNKEP